MLKDGMIRGTTLVGACAPTHLPRPCTQGLRRALVTEGESGRSYPRGFEPDSGVASALPSCRALTALGSLDLWISAYSSPSASSLVGRKSIMPASQCQSVIRLTRARAQSFDPSPCPSLGRKRDLNLAWCDRRVSFGRDRTTTPTIIPSLPRAGERGKEAACRPQTPPMCARGRSPWYHPGRS